MFCVHWVKDLSYRHTFLFYKVKGRQLKMKFVTLHILNLLRHYLILYITFANSVDVGLCMLFDARNMI